MIKIVREGGLRWNASSAEQSWGQKGWFEIQGNIPGDFIDKDTHHENTGQREAIKYLRERRYHRIECFVANSLTILMKKWYLNSNFQPYSYSQRFQKSADGIRINTSNLIYMWKVEMKGRR